MPDLPGRAEERAPESRPAGGDGRSPGTARDGDEPRQPRPILERLGLAFIALVFGGLFGGVAVAAWAGGEVFLAAMGGIGCLMTIWVGVLTLWRG
ncbi:MAG TPA: hypothetical protein VGC90_11330 [Candidatus Limnocylindrales bacterium]